MKNTSNEQIQALSTNSIHDKLFCYINKKHNTWILYCIESCTVFLIDPSPIKKIIANCIHSLYAKKYYCIFTRNHREKQEHLQQWKQLFPFKLLLHSPAYFNYNIHDEETQKERTKQEEIEQNIANITLIRGKYDIAHCLLAYKKPFLFSGEILQRKKDEQLHYRKISKTILNFLDKIPKDTIILPSVGPIELLQFSPILYPHPNSEQNI